MKQQSVVSVRQIQYPRIRLCVPRLNHFEYILVLGLVALLLWYGVKEHLIGRGFDKVVLPLGRAFVDVPVKGQVEDRTVGETAHDRHAEAHQAHLAFLVIAAGYIWECGYNLRAKLVGISTRTTVTEDRDFVELLPPFLNITALPHVRTDQEVAIIDVLRGQVRQPHRKPLVPSLEFLDRPVNFVELTLAGLPSYRVSAVIWFIRCCSSRNSRGRVAQACGDKTQRSEIGNAREYFHKVRLSIFLRVELQSSFPSPFSISNDDHLDAWIPRLGSVSRATPSGPRSRWSQPC